MWINKTSSQTRKLKAYVELDLVIDFELKILFI